MAFPNEQYGFLDALQSNLNDSIDLNQFVEGYRNISDEAYFPNVIDEENMTNDWSVNQNPDLVAEEHPANASLMGEAYSEVITHDQHVTSIPSEAFSYSSNFVQELSRSVRRINEAFLADATMQSNANQPLFNTTVDYIASESERARDSEQEIEQARQEQFLIDERVPLPIQMYQHAENEQTAPPSMPASFFDDFDYQTYFNEFGLIEPEQIQRINDSVINGEDINDEILIESQHDPLNDIDPLMLEDDYSDKSFSSWLFYGSDDDLVTFKNILSEENPEAVLGSEPQAEGASSNEKSKGEVANQRGKRAMLRPVTRFVSSLEAKQSSSHNKRRQSPALDNSDPFDANIDFQDTIISTSTPNSNNNRRCPFIESDETTRKVSLTRETQRSRYFVHHEGVHFNENIAL